MNRGLFTLVSAAALLVLFVAINIAGTRALRSARIDLTEGRLYTLSQGSKNIAAKLDEPIRLTMYFSERAANGSPVIRGYAQRVREMIEELSRASGGKIKLEVVDPLPFSENQDKADQAGIIANDTGRPERLYFGLVGVNSTDQQQVIPLLNPQGEEFLEYDLARMIHLLSNPKKAVVGVMTSLPMDGASRNPMMQGRGTPPWAILSRMRELFDVRIVPSDSATIPADVKVLMIVHPKNFSDRALYAIDQFAMRGGHLLVFTDPWCEADVPPGIDPMQAMQIPKASDLNKLLSAWGVEQVSERIATDSKRAIPVTIGSSARPERASYIAWLQLTGDDVNKNDAVTGSMRSIRVASAGILRKKDGATIDFSPLLQTTPEAAPLDSKEIQFIPDPKKLLASFVSGGQPLTIAARVSGKVKSAFPAGDPTKPAPAEGAPPADPGSHLAESKEPLQAIIVADCDLLTDRFWIQEQRLGGMVLGMSETADNGQLAIQSLDNLAGSSDLISLRARARFVRPFEKVQEIQRAAEQKFRAREQELDQQMQAAQNRLAELQRQKPEQGTLLLTPEQKAEIDKVRATLVDARKQQREVQFQLNKDVEALGDRLRLINIGLVPLLVGAFALGLAAYRANRRRSLNAAAGARS